MALQKIEKKLNQLFENSFSKVFPSRLEPIELSKKLIRELETTKQGNYLPHNISIYINVEDFHLILNDEANLVQKLEDSILTHSKEENYKLKGKPQIIISSDKKIKKGMVKFILSFDNVSTNQSAYLLIDNKFKKIEKDLTIGRSSQCDLMLIGQNISRQHAKINFIDHTFYISDTDSTNGVYVNDVKIQNNKQHILNNRDKIQIGDSLIIFRVSNKKSKVKK